MLRKAILIFAVLILIPSFSLSETIDVQIKGVDDGVKTTKQAKHGNIIGRDGDFILHRNGVVFDKKTNLEWYVGPDRDTNWDDAKSWIENANVAGWRMPTRKELKTLYKKGAGERNMTLLLKTSGWWVWSGETKSSKSAKISSSAWLFYFFSGNGLWANHNTSINARGFAVRSRK